MLKIFKVISIFLAGSLLGGALVAWAFNNPTQAPPGGSGVLAVDSSGNIGVGVVPSAKLHIGPSGAVDPFLVQTASGNTSLIIKNTSGNVGINTANPGYRLDVVGDANISGKLIVGQLCFGSSCNTSWPGIAGLAFGGMYSIYRNGADCSGSVNSSVSNPATNNISCPAGYADQLLNCAYGVPGQFGGTEYHYCYK